MTRTVLFATLLALSGAPGVAQDVESTGRVLLPPDVAQRVAELRTHGDRFEKAIRLIEAQAALPEWGWIGCGHGGVADLHFPES